MESTTSENTGYRALSRRFERVGHLGHVAAILGWDEAVMMPAGGGEARAEAMAALRVVIHGLTTDPGMADELQQASTEKLGLIEKANLDEMQRIFTRATALPAELVAASTRAEARCEQAWRTQRAESDWAGHRPLLEEVVHLRREAAAALSSKLGLTPYDALMDAFEPGARAATIEAVFDELERTLPQLLGEVTEQQRTRPCIAPRGPFAIDGQRNLGIRMMKAAGFDFDHGRLDVSHHPFCGGVPEDVRITTRYDENDFTHSLMAVLHETGHAKYEQGLPRAWRGQPVGLARSMSIHESQSLLQEMQVSRSPEFIAFIRHHVREVFTEQVNLQPEAYTQENMQRLYTRVQPGYIRVDADEVSYPLHVILRFRIERDLVEGKLQVADLPEVWDAQMRSLLGLATGDNHRDGCMQDVHWPSGAFGYFPSYTLGAMSAAQLFTAARRHLPELGADLGQGNLTALDAWLSTHVWSKASSLSTDQLMESASGCRLGTEAFVEHLKRRYLD